MRRTVDGTRSTAAPSVVPGGLTRRSSLALRVHRNEASSDVAATNNTNRRQLLGLLGLLGGVSAAQAAQAADPYEELRSITAARSGSQGSLLESFSGTRGAVSGAKTSRGIREKLGAEAANAPKPKPSFSFGGGSASSSTAALKPSSGASGGGGGGGGFRFSSPAAPKPPAAPRAVAAPAAGSSSSGGGAAAASIATGPLLQAAGVLGFVGLGASVASNIATSKPKYDAKKAEAPAAQPARAASPTPAAAKPAGSSTRKITNAAAPGAAASRAGSPVAAAPSRAASPTAASSGRSPTVVKKVPAAGAAASSGSTVKLAVKKALVNEEAPDEPTDVATGGFLGLVAVLAGFLLFGLPQPTLVEAPTQPAASNPLVEEARQAGAGAAQQASYVTPLFKGAGEAAVGDAAAAGRRAIVTSGTAGGAAPKLTSEPVKVAPLLPPKPAAVAEAPKPAPAAEAPPRVVAAQAAKPAAVAAAPSVVAEAPKVAAEAPKPAPAAPAVKLQQAAPAPAPKKQAPAPAPAAAAAEQGGPSAAQNLLVVAGGIAVVVTAFALTGSSSESGSSAGAAPAAGAGDAATAAASGAAAAETVSTAASAVAAAAPSEGTQQGNAAYDKAVLALMAEPDVTDDLMSVLSSGDQPLKNIPALAWALISTPANAESLDGFAFQKLPKQRYERVRQLMLNMGLQLPDTPRAQPGAAATLSPAGAVSSSDVDPERLRGVFEALLANESSRDLMRQLLKGAGMPFNEEAFEEQVKDSTYFNLAIAPILRNMPQQKLRVLAELQDPEKLAQLVSSVSSLALDSQQMQAVTAELSGDVRQTVDTIRAAERSSAPAGSE